MSIERNSKYYDDLYKNSEEYKLPFNQSVYYEMWLLILDLIPNKEIRITELGCGVGQFAQMLFENGFINYIGFDFSKEAIEMASKNQGQFHRTDLTEKIFTSKHNFFIALEIFEHTKDFKIIENLGLGKEIIFTVPDFNDASHVRYFHSVNEVVERYKNVLKFEYIKKYKSWYLCKAVTI